MTDPFAAAPVPAPTAADPPGSDPSEAPRRGRSRGWWDAFLGWPRFARITSYVAVGLVLVLLLVAVAVVVVVRRPLPQVTGSVPLAGLDADVTVVRDENGIPQLYADSVEDLMRGQGYVHAQERFFEMDVRRHATAGELSAMFGPTALDSDRLVRTMGWREVAAQELALVKPETRAALEAYAAGVNAYLEDHTPSQIAVEYTVLNAGGLEYRPEDWSPVDSLAWLKAMAWDLRGNLQDEIDRVLATAAVGSERTAQLYPAYPYDEHRPIVDQGAVVDGVFEPDATTGGTRNPERPAFDLAGAAPVLERLGTGLAAMPAWLGRGDGIGSNSWVVDGDRSATGMPLLANDPHLGVGMPGVWMQLGLHCRTPSDACPLDVAGFTFSGVPGVVIGHNADIAWGFTNLGPDVSDPYVERIRGDQWFYDGRWRPLRTRTETISVHGGQDVTVNVRSTRHGPLLSDASGDYQDVADQAPVDRSLADAVPSAGPVEYGVALQWTALKPSRTADAILELAAAIDWESFRAAAASFAVPAQNLVYADRAGHIGYQAPGRIPIRKSGNDGLLPSAGWLPENDWTRDVVPFDGLPSLLDPDEGLVVTANQAVARADYAYFLTDDWDRGYRSQRIRDLLASGLGDGPLTVEDLLGVQLDDENPMATTLTPYLLDADLPRGYQSAGQDLLSAWDFGQPADGPGSAAAAYYNVVWSNLLRLTFHDELPEGVRPRGGDRWYAVVTDLLRAPDDAWWDDVTTQDVVETRDDIVRAAMLAARDELTKRQARDERDWTWGQLHHLDLRSPTLGESGIGPVEWLVNREGREVGGGSSTVDATSWDAAVGYDVVAAPSMRMVVSLGDLDESRWINLTGVSGHPASPHYTDQTDLWVAGETLAWPFSREAVDAAAQDTLTLVPVAAPGTRAR